MDWRGCCCWCTRIKINFFFFFCRQSLPTRRPRFSSSSFLSLKEPHWTGEFFPLLLLLLFWVEFSWVAPKVFLASPPPRCSRRRRRRIFISTETKQKKIEGKNDPREFYFRFVFVVVAILVSLSVKQNIRSDESA